MNHIDRKRAELQSIYDVSALVEGSEEVIFSPTGVNMTMNIFFARKIYGGQKV